MKELDESHVLRQGESCSLFVTRREALFPVDNTALPSRNSHPSLRQRCLSATQQRSNLVEIEQGSRTLRSPSRELDGEMLYFTALDLGTQHVSEVLVGLIVHLQSDRGAREVQVPGNTVFATLDVTPHLGSAVAIRGVQVSRPNRVIREPGNGGGPGRFARFPAAELDQPDRALHTRPTRPPQTCCFETTTPPHSDAVVLLCIPSFDTFSFECEALTSFSREKIIPSFLFGEE